MNNLTSLKHFDTDYLDSYILHGPKVHGAEFGPDDWKVWRALERLYQDGSVKAIGASNVTPLQLKQLISDAEIVPHVVQIRCGHLSHAHGHMVYPCVYTYDLNHLGHLLQPGGMTRYLFNRLISRPLAAEVEVVGYKTEMIPVLLQRL